ncbi:MAG: hypothetical protein ABWX82_15570 [Leifsonia sp.]
MSEPSRPTDQTSLSRRTVAILVSAFVLIAIIAVVIASISRSQGSPASPTGSAGATSSPGSTSPATPGSTPGATDAPPIPVESTVPIDTPAQPAPGVTVALGSFEAVQGEAVLSGDVAGPAIRFTVTVTNGTDATVSLASALVNVYYGAAQSPADSLANPGGVPLPTEVAAGQSVQGTMIFTVPEDERDDVLITFDYQVGSPVTAFQGAVPR